MFFDAGVYDPVWTWFEKRFTQHLRALCCVLLKAPSVFFIFSVINQLKSITYVLLIVDLSFSVSAQRVRAALRAESTLVPEKIQLPSLDTWVI